MDSSEMYRDSKEIRNDGDAPLVVWAEPWAFALEVPPYSALLFESDSEQQGSYEIIDSDGPVIFAWPGANLRVTRDAELVYETDLRFPSVPQGMTTRQFLELVFGYSQPPKQRWWKFWRA